MNVVTNLGTGHDEAQEILDALRKIQDSPELRAEAKTNPESVVTGLGLSEVARHSVAFALAVTVISPIAGHLTTSNFWH